MVKISREEVAYNLELKYEKYKDFLHNGSEKDLIYTKGYCRALEQISMIFGDFSEEEIIEIKKPIIGNISMVQEEEVDLDTPTYLRKKK